MITPIPDPDPAVERPFGAWPTPITSELVVAAAVRLGEVGVDGDDVWWAEGRPDEGGRTQLVRRRADGGDGRPAARGPQRPHGRPRVRRRRVVGRATVSVWFTNWADQRLYRLEPGSAPVAVTPEPAAAARPTATPTARSAPTAPGSSASASATDGGRATDVVNEIVRSSTRARPASRRCSSPARDFVSAPRHSPGRRHAGLAAVGPPGHAVGRRRARGPRPRDGEETVRRRRAGRVGLAAALAADGSLWFLSDRTDWWNLYRWLPGRRHRADGPDARPRSACPQWVFGRSRYALLDDGRVVFARCARRASTGLAVRGRRRRRHASSTSLHVDRAVVARSRRRGRRAWRAAPTAEPVVLPGARGRRRVPTCCGRSAVLALGPRPRPGRRPGLRAGADRLPDRDGGAGRARPRLFYPPTNPGFRGSDGERPPLLVVIHGGPTAGACRCWTSPCSTGPAAGFAVVDVDYGGSTGYGRPYRELLHGQWGVVDVDDCVAAARCARRPRPGRPRPAVHPRRLGRRLHDAGRAGPRRHPVRGRAPATTASPTSRRWPATRTSSRAATSTGWSGPYPDGARRLRRALADPPRRAVRPPLIVLQGVEDAVVPPAQSETIVAALRDKGVPVAYLLFEGEQHGFRQRRTSAGRWTPSCRSTPRSSASRPTRASSRSRWRTYRPSPADQRSRSLR